MNIFDQKFWLDYREMWREVKNSNATDSATPSRGSSKVYTIYPCGQATIDVPSEDQIVRQGTSVIKFEWPSMIPATGIPGTQLVKLKAIPDSGGDIYPLIPCTLVASEADNDDLDVVGELDLVFWFPAEGGQSSEDTIKVGNDRYFVVQNGNRSTTFSFMAIKEE